MARRCFYSFHYLPDNWRVAKVRNIGVIEGNKPAPDNDWESVTRRGDQAIKDWIAGQMRGRSCTIVLIGSNTAGRKWINYEISETWNARMGVVGIHVHKLLDRVNRPSTKGGNPLYNVTFKGSGNRLSTIAKTYDPAGSTSAQVYASIAANLDDWVEEAVRIRAAN